MYILLLIIQPLHYAVFNSFSFKDQRTYIYINIKLAFLSVRPSVRTTKCANKITMVSTLRQKSFASRQDIWTLCMLLCVHDIQGVKILFNPILSYFLEKSYFVPIFWEMSYFILFFGHFAFNFVFYSLFITIISCKNIP